MTETTVLEDLATQVANNREIYDALKAEWDALCAAFNNRYERVIDDLAKAKQAMMDSETNLRAAGLELYATTGEKKLPRGLGVRVTTKLEYDPATALEWAKSHDLALTLDKSAFEKIAKADTPDFVTVVEVPTVTLPTDSAKLLGGGE